VSSPVISRSIQIRLSSWTVGSAMVARCRRVRCKISLRSWPAQSAQTSCWSA